MSFIWNGVSSDAMKFNVTSRQVYTAPAYDLNAIEVPGRSGDLLNPQNRFKNKQVTYTGFLKASDFEGSTWREKLSTGLIQLKGWLCSDAGAYHELTDDYDPGFTRYGYISGETAISDIEDRPFGVTLTVTFNVKPYMYKAGEPMELPETKSASGSIITITDGAENTPLKSAVVNIEPVQSGSGDPSPSNIRPISGWTHVSGARTGKNLLPAIDTVTRNGITLTNNNGKYTLSGTASAATNFDVFLPLPIAEGTKISVILHNESVSSGVLCYTQTAQPANINGLACSVVGQSGTFTLTADLARFRLRVNSGTVLTNFVLAPMIVFGDARPTFESYQGTPITIPLGQTVYGGTVDAIAGKMVIDRKILDLGTMSWTYKTQGYFDGYLSAVSSEILRPSSGSEKVGIICSQYIEQTSNNIYNGVGDCEIAVRNSNGDIWVRDSTAGTDAAAFKTAMNGVKAVYYLATPIEYDLDPQTIKTLLGTNNIWADAGSMEIEYPVPTENPYPFGSRPLYEITMAGTGTLAVNGKEWAITDYTGTLYCDTEAMEWYDASQLRNNIVSGDGWPVFEAGENSVSYTGDITKVMVTPRWRTL